MFFARFKSLCDRKGVSVYKACTDVGLNRSAVAKWKAGSQPNGATAARLAAYFGVTTDHLLGRGESAQAAVTDEQIKFALFGGDGEITDEMYEEVKKFAAFVKQRHREQE